MYRTDIGITGFTQRIIGNSGSLSALERSYPRICEGIIRLWHKKEAQSYLDSLIVEERYDRQGFPQEVIEELMFLSDLNWLLENDNDQSQAALAASERFTFATDGHLQDASGEEPPQIWV